MLRYYKKIANRTPTTVLIMVTGTKAQAISIKDDNTKLTTDTPSFASLSKRYESVFIFFRLTMLNIAPDKLRA